MRIFH